jgi:flagellar biosynthesis protein
MMNRRQRARESYLLRPPRQPVATALQFNPEKDNAPRIVATGKGKTAEKILSLAKENNVPVYDDPVLAVALSTVKLGDEIPPELYLVVAEVLAYLYRVSRGQYPSKPT